MAQSSQFTIVYKSMQLSASSWQDSLILLFALVLETFELMIQTHQQFLKVYWNILGFHGNTYCQDWQEAEWVEFRSLHIFPIKPLFLPFIYIRVSVYDFLNKYFYVFKKIIWKSHCFFQWLPNFLLICTLHWTLFTLVDNLKIFLGA